jgi:anion-transporting  ArsA/GET3 family ATPase
VSPSPPSPGAASAPRPPLARVVLVTGKGGVGKTTIAAGLAVAQAALVGSAALVEFGDGESGLRALGRQRGVDHIVIKPEEALTRAASPLFGNGLLARVALGNFAVKRMLKAAPALRELAMLECIRLVAAEKPRRAVIVDMPATGHGIAWLRVPRQLREVSQSGPFFELCDRVARELVTPGRCSPVVVTLPEKLVLKETLELCESMASVVGLPAARLIVNRMPAEIAHEAVIEAERLAAGHSPRATAARSLAEVLRTREAARRDALSALDDARTGGPGLAPVLLPEAPVDPSSAEVAEWLRTGGALP